MRNAALLAVLSLCYLVGTTPGLARDAPLTTPRVGAAAAGLSWGGKRFLTRHAFGLWLRPRGLGYSAWAVKHPAGRRILATALRHPRSAGTATTPTETAPPITTVALAPPLVHPAPAKGHRSALTLALVIAALLLGAASLLPLWRLAPTSPVVMALTERRATIIAPAIAILLGLLVAKLSS